MLDIDPRLRATFPKNAVKKKIKVTNNEAIWSKHRRNININHIKEPMTSVTIIKISLIQVGLQTQSIPPEIVKAAFGRSVEVSRMVAVEPRKRKFHEVPILFPPNINFQSLSSRCSQSLSRSLSPASRARPALPTSAYSALSQVLPDHQPPPTFIRSRDMKYCRLN